MRYVEKLKFLFDYSVRRSYVDIFFQNHIPSIKNDSLILDLGGHKYNKRGIFDISIYKHLRVFYINLTTGKLPDIQADAYNLPIKDKSLDVVICGELLEHIFEPRIVLDEVYRVLVDGGQVLITVPFLYRIHADPYDFGRYTDYYWQTALELNGFEDISIEHQGLFLSVLVDFIRQYMIQGGNIRPPRPIRFIAHIILILLWKFVTWCENQPCMKKNEFARSFTTGFGITAVKKFR